jgi:uncharacterized protein (DUF4415 family)
VEDLGPALGDKIRVKTGRYSERRGRVTSIKGARLWIRLDDIEAVIVVSAHDVTNYSLAARKAWAKMPKKSGRPRGSKALKKMVSLRLDNDVLDLLDSVVDKNIFDNKSEAINTCLRKQLAQYLRDRNGA